MRKCCVAFAYVCQVAALFAQVSPDKPIDVSGAVVNSVTGQPIADVLVVLDPGFRVIRPVVPSPAEGGQAPAEPVRLQSQRALTDLAGKFAFRVPFAGTMSLRISHRGYRSESNSDVAYLTVLPGAVEPMTIKLVPLSIFEGRVVNGDGEPLPGVSVEAIRIQVRDGRREPRLVASKTTDDLGNYRLWYLSPGTYYLKVAGRRGTINAVASTPQAYMADDAYGPVYYPAATSQEGAQIFRLAPGQTVSANFTVESRTAYRIRGRLSSPVHNRRIAVRLMRGDDPMGNRSSVNLSTGAFEVFDVTPGIYTLQAYTSDAADLLFGEAAVTVEQRDLTGVEVSMTSGVEVACEMDSAGEERRFVQIAADHVGGSPLPPGASIRTMARIQESGKLTLAALWPGRYELNFTPAGSDYVTSATAGGVDLMAADLTVTTSAPPPIKLQIDAGAGAVDVTVPATPAPESITIIAVRGGVRPQIQVAVSQIGTDLHGWELPPGEYLLYAWPSARQVEYRNPMVLAGLSSYAVHVSVQSGGHHAATVKLMPREEN